MKVIIAGSRPPKILNYKQTLAWFELHSTTTILDAVLLSGWRDQITEVVCGMAQGFDMIGHAWAEAQSIPIKPMPASWKALGWRAGFIRNVEMADYADRLIAIWDGVSNGTRDMIEQMEKRQKPYFVYRLDASNPPRQIPLPFDNLF